jgi:hypothetical protein
MRKNLLVPLALSLLFLEPNSGTTRKVYGQEKAEPRVCPDIPGQTSGTHRFRYLGEIIEIPLRGDGVPASVADCEPVALDLRWANGRNNGSNFTVTFLDGNKRPIYTKYFSGFMAGVVQYPLSSFDQPMYGSSLAVVSVPSAVTIQAGEPVAAPATLSYTVTRVARPSRAQEKGEGGNGVSQEREKYGNEIVSIHSATRLIGASRLPLVQIELKTSRPFPVREVPLQLQIGNKTFLDELSGDYTGRRLTLSLTPDMFAELKDGEEIRAFFGKASGNVSAEGDVCLFGKLNKKVNSKQ